MYGVHQFDDAVSVAGIFSIDTTTFVATSVLPFPAGAATTGGLSGLAGDGGSGLLYAADDNGGQILSLDPVGGTVAVVAAYPAGQSDIDGAAFGNGIVYLVPDDSAGIFPYNIAAGGYGTTIPSPFGAADLFSGGAFLAASGPSDADLALQLDCGLVGGGVDCTATVNNLGPDDASGVVVTVTIPGGLTYAGDGCLGSAVAGVWTWSLGSLMAGASDACTLSMTVDAGSTGPWTVIGSVTHAGNDPNPSNDRSTEQVSLISPIPTLSDTGVVMLILGLIVGALIVLRRTF
jgi:uncharacterized repeat protein (TIGR01451 family)